jgi:hypothetical protein
MKLSAQEMGIGVGEGVSQESRVFREIGWDDDLRGTRGRDMMSAMYLCKLAAL